MMFTLLLPLLLASTSAFASFGDKIGNGGGLWACKRGDKIVKAQLVDLFEAQREFLLKIPTADARDPFKIFEIKRQWLKAKVPALYINLEANLKYVEDNRKLVRADLQLIDDHGLFRSRPLPSECPRGEWGYIQFANSNDDEEVLIRDDLWNSRVVSNIDKAALLFHEAVYRWLRVTRNETDSIHTRKIVGLLFSDLEPQEIENRIYQIINDGDLPPNQRPVGKDILLEARFSPMNAGFLHRADAAYGQNSGTGNFSSDCRISAKAKGSDQDILCILEVEELDLYFNKLTLDLNVPRDSCTYVSFSPFSFYSREPGIGPTEVAHDVLFDGTVRDVNNTRNGAATCPFDYTAEGGPNCCEGSYTHTVQTFASDNSVESVVRTANYWSGKAANCLSGPGSTSALKAKNGFPLPEVYYSSGMGNRLLYTVTPPAQASSTPLASNVWTANFYNPMDHQAGKPAAMLKKFGHYGPHDTYEWNCLDAAQDIKARIRLMVREWNSAPIRENGNPDEGGAGSWSDPINDRFDWKDFGDTYPGANL